MDWSSRDLKVPPYIVVSSACILPRIWDLLKPTISIKMKGLGPRREIGGISSDSENRSLQILPDKKGRRAEKTFSANKLELFGSSETVRRHIFWHSQQDELKGECLSLPARELLSFTLAQF